jgi:hypothetical protein
MLPRARQSLPKYMYKCNLLFNSHGVSWPLAHSHNITNSLIFAHAAARCPADCPYLFLVNNNLLFTYSGVSCS